MSSLPQPDPWIGRLIGDRQRYRLDMRLGAGGMGDVFVAMDTLLSKQVALKLLKNTLVESEALRKRFEREVTVCAALKSDHIVDVSNYGVTAEGHPFYVMEYLRGQSLGQLLRQQQRLSVERTVTIISQVCEGLRLAHGGVTLWRDGATASEQIKVVHRDLKPDNIFLVPTTLGELVKILDFGIAKICKEAAEHTNLTSMFIGTFHYAAPEQLEVETDLDGRADIYSLGMILYEMLSGTDPFGLGFNTHQKVISGMSWALAHTSKPPVPMRSQPSCEHLSPELEAVVLRCLQKVPAQRFASVDELNVALQTAVAVEPRASGTTSLPLTAAKQYFDPRIVPQTLNPLPQPGSAESRDNRSPTPAQQQASHSDRSRPLTPSRQGVSDAFSPEHDSLLEIFRDFVGPIADTLFRQVSAQADSTKELVENLALYLSPNQRMEFDKMVRSLQEKSTVQPQTRPHSSPTIQPQTRPHHSPSLSKSALNANFIQQCERELVDLIGPIATFLIQNALKSNPQISPVEFMKILAGEISDPQKAEKFYRRLLE